MGDSASAHATVVAHIPGDSDIWFLDSDWTRWGAQIAVLSGTRPDNPVRAVAVWELSFAPDRSGVVLQRDGLYVTSQSVSLPGHGDTLMLSTDITQAAHFVPGDVSNDGDVSLAFETDPSRYLTLRTDGYTIQLNPLHPANEKPYLQQFDGSALALPSPTTFGDMVPIPADFFDDEVARFSNDINYFILQSDGLIKAAEPNADQASSFLLEAAGDAKVVIRVNNSYLGVDSAGKVRTAENRREATRFKFFATPAQGVVISTAEAAPRYWNLDPSGALTASTQAAWDSRLEFWMEIEPIPEAEHLARLSLSLEPEYTDCQKATATMVWQCTGGLFLAAGLGPGIIAGEPSPGFIALISSLDRNIGTAVRRACAAIDSPGVKVFGASMAVYTLARAIIDGGVWWQVLKALAWQAAGWYVIPKLVSLAVRYFFTAEIEAVALMVSMLSWFGNVTLAATNVMQSCGRSDTISPPSP